ncbi:MAG: right-handed parallel beta-helix repeat-containing protein [Bacteroidetes bacterium]|nr:right-handed parallel beta-helix repeat-containing protein [Bacteroidota bacterium]
MIISRSATVKNREYHIKGIDSLSTAIVIEGENITIDFNGAVINGTTDPTHPDQFKGTGIFIKHGKNITLKNLVVRGFKVGVLARGIRNLKIINSDLSYNFRQHLNSSRQIEDLADWQSYHHNEHDESLRYGAGIYLESCDSADIHSNKIIEGQCGLMLTRCNDALVYNNDFSYNSGLGIGMYRSSHNRVMNNKLDWNVRGYSFGGYYRGQDSAGILVFEQSSDNVFAYNSVTHSGDGFFLWAGQTTMDSGEGGCNDNLVYANDFSYAPTNGVEITFSRNKIIGNIIHECWHGVWGGFSYNTVIANNDFGGNLSAIAIEHGQHDIIDQNTFKGDKMGIELWSNPKRPKDIGYLKNRDTRSIDYEIRNNSFAGLKNVFSINNTADLVISNNKVTGSMFQQKMDSTIKNLEFDKTGDQIKPVIDSSYFPKIKTIPGAQNAQLPADHPKGKKYIMMNEWGPYSFDYPMLWLDSMNNTGKMYFELLGSAGNWKVLKVKGASNLSLSSGTISAQLTAQKDTASLTDIDIKLEYIGKAVTSQFGAKYPAGKPFIFHYREFVIPYHWQTRWFAFDTLSDPVKHIGEFEKLIAGVPDKISEGAELSTVFGRNFGKGIPTKNIATVSTSVIDVPEGAYKIGVSASEIMKVYIDGKLVIENWDPAKLVYDADYHKDATIHLKGKHIIRIVQAQYGDYGMLNLRVQTVENE